MKRPLFWIGAVFLSSMAVFLCFPPQVSVALAIFIIPLAAAFLCARVFSLRRLLLLLAFSLLGLLYPAVYNAIGNARLSPVISEQPALLHATVTECRGVSGYQTVSARADITANGVTRTADIELSGYFADIPEAGAGIACRASFSGGRWVLDELLPPIESGSPHPFLSARLGLQSAVSDKLYALFGGREGGVICAVLTGDRSRLDENVVSDFQRSSLSHLLAVSGMHLIMISHLVSMVLSRFIGFRARFIAMLCFCWGFAAISGLGVSIVRAAVMLTVMHIGSLIRRKSDTLTSLMTAALILALPQPEVIVSASFLLSFSAVAGLAVLQRPICSLLCGKESAPALKYAAESLSSAAAAQIATLPACALLFGTVPILGVFANLAAVWLLQPVMALGILSLALGSIHSVLAAPFAFICKRLTALLLLIARGFAGIPFSSVGFSEYWQLIWLAGSALLIAAVLCRRELKAAGTAAAVGLSAACAATALFAFACGTNQADILLFKESGCTAIVKGGHAVLIGSPENRWQRLEIESAFAVLGVERLDAVILPDSKQADYSTARLASGYGCDALCSENDRRAAAFCQSARMELYALPENAALFGDMRVTVGENGYEILFEGGKLLKTGEKYDIIGKYNLPMPPDGAVRLRVDI